MITLNPVTNMRRTDKIRWWEKEKAMRLAPNTNAAIVISLLRPRTVFPGCKVKCACKGPRSDRSHEKPEGARFAVKDIFRKDGEEHVIGHPDKTHEPEKEKDIPYREKPGRVPVALF